MIIATIIERKPIRVTTGATFMWMALKMEGSNSSGVDLPPAIRKKPISTTNTPTATRMKFNLPKVFLVDRFDSRFLLF